MPARIISLWNYPLHETSNILGPVGIQIFYQPSRKESLRLWNDTGEAMHQQLTVLAEVYSMSLNVSVSMVNS